MIKRGVLKSEPPAEADLEFAAESSVGAGATLAPGSGHPATGEISRRNEVDSLAFFDMIDDFAFVLDHEGRILRVNQAARDRLGYQEAELIGRSVLQLHPPDRGDEASRILADLLAGKTLVCPLPLRARDGRLIPVETRVVRDSWSGEQVLLGLSKDVSQLRGSEEKFATAFHGNPSPMAISSIWDGRFEEVNEAFLRLLGYERDEVVGALPGDLALFVDADQRDAALQILREQGILTNFELRVRTKHGQVVHGLFSGHLLQLQARRLLLTVMIDITERKKAEELLRRQNEMLKRSLLASDTERQMLAYEIHDSLAQLIAGALLQFQASDPSWQSSPERANAAFHEGLRILRESHQEVRRLIRSVRPLTLDEMGVVAALAYFLQGFQGNPGPEIEFHSAVEFDRLQPIEENSIYRIVQEGVTNARKHSQSTESASSWCSRATGCE